MFRKNSFSIQINKRIFIPRITVFGILLFSMVLAGCDSFPSPVDDAFEKEYEAAKEKSDKYLNGPVSGREVLDLINNWDETDYGLAVDGIKSGRYRVSNIDKNKTIFKYWDKDLIYYIDPDAFYEGGFILYQNPRKENDKGIGDLYLALVEDPTMTDDSITDQND